VDAEAKRKAAEAELQRLSAAPPGSAQSFRDLLANGQPCSSCPEMVIVPAGSFTMGSPPTELGRTPREMEVKVTIAQPFAAARFAVTFDEWDACVADRGCAGYRPEDGGWGRGKRPVINVSWGDAKSYADWLSRKTGKTYRLLSEAEREYATRAGTTTPFWWGSSITPEQANYDGTAYSRYGGGLKQQYRKGTVPVDSFEPNPWGLYNVHGNIWEWTEDCWNEVNSGNPGNGNARVNGDCSRQVVRGGSLIDVPEVLRSAYRNGRTGVSREKFLGFRVGRALTP
jgi:formylglycine-generating enzyme required for sulfatase activity